jgi:hypothetical protein
MHQLRSREDRVLQGNRRAKSFKQQHANKEDETAEEEKASDDESFLRSMSMNSGEPGDDEIQEELSSLPISTILEVSTKAYEDLSKKYASTESKCQLLIEANKKLREQLMNQHVFKQAFVRWKLAAGVGGSTKNGSFTSGALFGAISTLFLCASMMTSFTATAAVTVLVIAGFIGASMRKGYID